MKFDVLTLFPDMFECLNQSIIGRAKEKELIDINLINIRDFSNNKHKKVDDTPYGGGSGMVMMPDVVYRAYESVKTKDAKVIYMTPQGKKLDQKKVEDLAKQNKYISIKNRYCGIDLNPNFVGFSVKDPISNKIIHTEQIDLKKLTGKNVCHNKLNHETKEIFHYIGRKLKN